MQQHNTRSESKSVTERLLGGSLDLLSDARPRVICELEVGQCPVEHGTQGRHYEGGMHGFVSAAVDERAVY